MMDEINFFEIAALSGDAQLRGELKEVWDALDPPSDGEVEMYLCSKHGFDRRFTDDERIRARTHLMHRMAEEVLRQRLGWSDEELWEDETEEEAIAALAADTGSVALAPAAVAARRTWSSANDDSLQHALMQIESIEQAEAASPARHFRIVDAGLLDSPTGKIQVGDDGELVFVQRPLNLAPKGIRLGSSSYALEDDGNLGMLRVAGLSHRKMQEFFEAHRRDAVSNSVEWLF